jgi:hypothetical protein
MAVKPDAAETFWNVNVRVSPKLWPRELVGLLLGRNPSSLGRWTTRNDGDKQYQLARA